MSQRRSASTKRPSLDATSISNAATVAVPVTVPAGSRRRATPAAPATPPDMSDDSAAPNDDTAVLQGQSIPPARAESGRHRSPSVPADAVSPPKRHVRIIALTPPRGCSTDELRDHFDVVVDQLRSALEQLATAQEASVRRADFQEQQVRALRQACGEEIFNAAKAERADTNTEFRKLREELNTFSSMLVEHNGKTDTNTAHLVAVEAAFREHVSGAFTVVEQEFAKLQTNTANAVHGAYTHANAQASQATADVQMSALNDRLTQVEVALTKSLGQAQCEGGHCTHVTHLLGEMQNVQRAIIELRARGANPVAPGKGAGSIGQPCHCPHVTQLLLRVDKLEKQVADAQQTPQRAPFLGPDGCVNATPPGVDAQPQYYGHAPRQAQTWDYGNNADGRHAVRWDRIFDDKIPVSPQYAYTGGTGNSNSGESGGNQSRILHVQISSRKADHRLGRRHGGPQTRR